MAIVQELGLFSWKDFQDDLQNLGDLERFKLVIETIPDQNLIQILQKLRNKGRNDHPIQAMWNSILGGIVFEHVSVETLRRELRRNAQFREMCGFNPLAGVNAVPSKSAYSRFLSSLLNLESHVREMFDTLVKELVVTFPKFGINLAGDGKAIHSLAKPPKKRTNNSRLEDDRRREEDADWGVKKYHGIDADGNAWEKVK
jgi:hypothetical protein